MTRAQHTKIHGENEKEGIPVSFPLLTIKFLAVLMLLFDRFYDYIKFSKLQIRDKSIRKSSRSNISTPDTYLTNPVQKRTLWDPHSLGLIFIVEISRPAKKVPLFCYL